MKKILIFGGWLFVLPLYALEFPKNIRTGDLVFVSDGVSTIRHVGLFEVDPGPERLFVYEARRGLGVVRTPYRDFFARFKGALISARIRAKFRDVFIRAAAYARGNLSKPYNARLAPNAEGFYCSQLIQNVSRFGNRGVEVFHSKPMTFGSPNSSQRVFWESYFAQLKVKIPEGELGISPSAIYLEGKGRVFD